MILGDEHGQFCQKCFSHRTGPPETRLSLRCHFLAGVKQGSNTQRLKRVLILIGQHKTCAHFQGKPLFQATDRKTVIMKIVLLTGWQESWILFSFVIVICQLLEKEVYPVWNCSHVLCCPIKSSRSKTSKRRALEQLSFLSLWHRQCACFCKSPLPPPHNNNKVKHLWSVREPLFWTLGQLELFSHETWDLNFDV